MIQEKTRILGSLVYAVELLIVAADFFAVYFLMSYFHLFYQSNIFPRFQMVSLPRSLDLYMRAFVPALIIWVMLLHIRGGYDDLRTETRSGVLRRFAATGILYLGCFASVAFLMRFDFIGRTFMLYYAASCTVLLVLSRFILMSMAAFIWKRGWNNWNIVLVGTGRRAQRFMSLIAKHKEWGYRIVGLLDGSLRQKGRTVAGYHVDGVLEDLPAILERREIDEVVFVTPRKWLEKVEKCLLYCEAVGMPATLSTDLFELEIASGTPQELDGFTYLTFKTRLLKESELLVKRIIDILFSAAILFLTAPVLAATACAVKASSPGPVFFRQVRSGRNGKRFTLYKFRSMVVDAEARLAQLKAHNEMSGPVFKMTDDPRVTRVGKWLRKTSLDEFPQFWNVLKGDMSVVGPRPPLPSEVEKYEPWQRRRLSMKPGITCIWQVSGRNSIGFEEWMHLDLQYIDNWSLWLDLKILALTAKPILTGSGH